MMTSRERVRRTLDRLPTDRLPNGLGGSETSGMHLLAYDMLKKILGVESAKNRMSTFLTTSIFEPEVLDAIQGDMVILGSRLSPARFWGEGNEKTWKEQQFWGKTFQVATPWQFRQMENGGIYWEDWNLTCPPCGIYFDSVFPYTESLDPNDFNPSCDILDDLIECGTDVINPVQISARGMDPSELKKNYGDRIIFYGGAYDAVLCPKDMPAAKVYEEVKRNIGIFSENGGFIFAGVHNIPGDIAQDHLEAIVRAYEDSSVPSMSA